MPGPAIAASTWLPAAIGAASGPLAMGIQRLGVNYDYRKQREQQQKLMEMQIQGESRLMELQQQNQMEMWENTGYGAQKDQMKRAGLNPALMYGMGGGGGQTIGGGMPSINVATAENPQTSRTAGAMVGMGLQGAAQLALLNAQKENIEADTANKKADVPVKEASVPNIQQDTKTKEQQEETLIKQQELIIQQTNEKIEQVKAQVRENKIGDATADDSIKRIRAEAIGAGLINILTTAQTSNVRAQTTNTKEDTKLKGEQITTESVKRTLMDTEASALINKVSQEWERIGQNERELRLKIIVQEVIQKNTGSKEYPVQMHEVEKITKELMQLLNNIRR